MGNEKKRRSNKRKATQSGVLLIAWTRVHTMNLASTASSNVRHMAPTAAHTCVSAPLILLHTVCVCEYLNLALSVAGAAAQHVGRRPVCPSALMRGAVSANDRIVQCPSVRLLLGWRFLLQTTQLRLTIVILRSLLWVLVAFFSPE